MFRTSRRYQKQARDELRKMNRRRPTFIEALQEVADEGQARAAVEKARHAAALEADPSLAAKEALGVELQKLADMRKRGWLTDAEFAAGKAKLLA